MTSLRPGGPSDPGPRMNPPAARRAAAAAALLLAGVRAAFIPVSQWALDGALVLCLFAAGGVLMHRRREWPFVVLAVMGWLSGIYLLRQGGAMIAVLGILP
jgi:hypothetical protein